MVNKSVIMVAIVAGLSINVHAQPKRAQTQPARNQQAQPARKLPLYFDEAVKIQGDFTKFLQNKGLEGKNPTSAQVSEFVAKQVGTLEKKRFSGQQWKKAADIAKTFILAVQSATYEQREAAFIKTLVDQAQAVISFMKQAPNRDVGFLQDRLNGAQQGKIVIELRNVPASAMAQMPKGRTETPEERAEQEAEELSLLGAAGAYEEYVTPEERAEQEAVEYTKELGGYNIGEEPRKRVTPELRSQAQELKAGLKKYRTKIRTLQAKLERGTLSDEEFATLLNLLNSEQETVNRLDDVNEQLGIAKAAQERAKMDEEMAPIVNEYRMAPDKKNYWDTRVASGIKPELYNRLTKTEQDYLLSTLLSLSERQEFIGQLINASQEDI